MRNKFTFLLVFLGAYVHSYASGVHLFDYDISGYPIIKAKIFVTDDFGKPKKNLTLADLKVIENGIERNIVSLNCPTQVPDIETSVLMMFDLAMDSTDISNSKMHFARVMAERFIQKAPLTTTELAISSFDYLSYMNNDFRILSNFNRNELTNIVLEIPVNNTSNFQSGFLDSLNGAIDILSRAKFKKNLILFSDGNIKTDIDKIIDKLKTNNIRVFSVSLSSTISDPMRKLAESTGGAYFDGLDSLSYAQTISEILISQIYNYSACEISWNSIQDCQDAHKGFVNYVVNDTIISKKRFSFIVPEKYKPSLESYGVDGKSYLRFSSVLPGKTRNLSLNITPKNGKITIKKFSIPNDVFKITQGDITSDLVLNVGDVHNLTITFTPKDSSIEFSKLIIESNACFGSEVLITGGFPNKEPRPGNNTLKIINPNEGDVWIVGDSVNVSWTGLLPADVIQLEYSLNNGVKFDTLAYDINSGNEKTMDYSWKVPDLVSDSCRIRAIQLWPNNIGQTLDLKHTSSVMAGCFNKEGSLAATCTKDSMAFIWNSNNGKKIYELFGHKKQVNWVAFDNLEVTKYLVTASEDNTAIIFDVETGKKIHQLIGHKNHVNAAMFNLDATKVLTSSTDGMVIQWDVATGTPIDTITKGPAIRFASYSPDNKYVGVIYASDNNARLWDISTKKVIQSYPMKIVGNVHLAFSPDGSKVAISSWSGRIGVFNTLTGDSLYEVRHHDSLKPVNSSSFNFDGTILLTSSVDWKVKMWRGDNGQKYGNTFDEHINSVMTAVFNFDNSRVLSASWDSTAKIWKLDKKDLQADTSGVFRIARAKLEARDIDFGSVVFNRSKDTTLTSFIINKSYFPIDIKQVKITGPNPEDFLIKDYPAPYYIDSLGIMPIRITFTPKTIGYKEANIEIDYSGGNKLIKKISGIGVQPSLELISNMIYYNEVELGELKDSVVKIIATNKSNSDIIINNVNLIMPDTIHYKIVAADNISILRPNASFSMILRYFPDEVIRNNGLVSIKHNGYGSPDKINLFGEGIKPTIDTVTFYMGAVSAAPGSAISIPLKVKNLSQYGLNKKITGFNFKLEYNPTILEPTFNYLDNQIINNKGIISFNTDTKIGTDSVLKQLTFKVGLGNDTISKLDLTEITHNGFSRIKIYHEDQIFTLDGLCKDGTTRLFYSDNKISLSQPMPNPASDYTIINFETIENGNTKLMITDVMGNIVSIPFESNILPGKYQKIINLSDLSPGVYNLSLITPSIKLINKIYIIK